MERKVTRQVKVRRTPLFVLVAMILIVIGVIVAIFVSFVKDDMKHNNANSLILTDNSSTNSVTSSEKPVSSQPPASQEPTVEQVKVDTIVPETVKVKDEYFDDALFIGDSISKGLKLYGVVPEGNVLADQNVGLDQIYRDKEVYYISTNKKATLWNAIDAKMKNPKKIYVLLGTNGIPGYENDRQMVFYADLIDKLKKKYPDAIIYVESVTPITQETSQKRKTFTSAKINDFNKRLLELAKKKSVYYVDIEKTLKDENGYLKAEYDGGDGTHMPGAGHQAVYSYLKSHTATKDGYATVVSKK